MAINPLNFFDVGAQVGAVNSPAFGPAQMIRNVLQDAQKKGLLKAQSDAQLGGAKELAQFKSGLEPKTKDVFQIDRSGKLNPLGPVDKNAVVKQEPAPALGDFFTDDSGAGTPGATNTPAGLPEGVGATPTPAQAIEARARGAVGYDRTRGVFVDAQGNPI